MRVLFLDFDGVLNSGAWMRRQPEGTNFLRAVDPEAVARLAEIVRRTDARIVVSSTWRILNPLPDLRGILIAAGYPAPCPIIGATPKRVPYPEPASANQRGYQIQAWMDGRIDGDDGRGGWNRSIASFVILDDDSDMAHLTPRLVQTSFETGLLDEHVERVVALLTASERA